MKSSFTTVECRPASSQAEDFGTSLSLSTAILAVRGPTVQSCTFGSDVVRFVAAPLARRREPLRYKYSWKGANRLPRLIEAFPFSNQTPSASTVSLDDGGAKCGALHQMRR
jgi:hypothetical protein